MKSIKDRLITESINLDFSSLHYVLSFSDFKRWIKNANEDEEYYILVIDGETDIQEYSKLDLGHLWWDNGWNAGINGDTLSIDEWTTSDTDIILVFIK